MLADNRARTAELRADIKDRQQKMLSGEIAWPSSTPAVQPQPVPPQLTLQQRATAAWENHLTERLRANSETMIDAAVEYCVEHYVLKTVSDQTITALQSQIDELKDQMRILFDELENVRIEQRSAKKWWSR